MQQDFLEPLFHQLSGRGLNVFDVADACSFPAHDLLNILQGHRDATPAEIQKLQDCQLTFV